MLKINRNYILPLFAILLPTPTVYSAWGWSTFSNAVSGCFDRIYTTISDISPKFIAVGCTVTASITALYFWGKNKNREITRLKREKNDVIVQLDRSMAQHGNFVTERREYDKVMGRREQALLSQLQQNRDLIAQLESGQIESKIDTFDAASQTGDILQEWEVVRFDTPNTVEDEINNLVQSYKNLYAEACSVNVDEQTDIATLKRIRSRLEIKESGLISKKKNLHTLIATRTETADSLYNRLAEEYKVNNDRIPKNLQLSPSRYYEYLGLEIQSGKSMTSAEITAHIENLLSHEGSADGKWALRQVRWVFCNDASKSHYDAYLGGPDELNPLIFDKTATEKLLGRLTEIDEAQMPIRTYAAKLNRRIKLLNSN